MSAETVASTIQLILAPAVMVTACAILLGGPLTMFVIAVAAAANSAAVATVALILFLLGTGIVSWGVLLTAVEVRQSQRAVEYEVRRVAGLRGERT